GDSDRIRSQRSPFHKISYASPYDHFQSSVTVLEFSCAGRLLAGLMTLGLGTSAGFTLARPGEVSLGPYFGSAYFYFGSGGFLLRSSALRIKSSHRCSGRRSDRVERHSVRSTPAQSQPPTFDRGSDWQRARNFRSEEHTSELQSPYD